MLDARILRVIARTVRPLPRMNAVEWGETYRTLGPDESEPGPWRAKRTPWIREILEVLSTDHPAQDIVFMKPAQVAATEAGVIWSGYLMHYAPGRILLIQPTIDMAKRHSKTRYKRFLDDTPVLKELVVPPRSRLGSNTILWKEFRGGVLVITGANSEVGLRSLAAPYLHGDEVDGYPYDFDVIGQAEKRSQTFPNRKHYYPSTPLDFETSRIEPLYNRSDQRHWRVDCPYCGHAQELLWRHPVTGDRLITWPFDRPHEAVYMCQGCAAAWSDSDKIRSQDSGIWVGKIPWALPMPVGFWMQSLNSPWVTWSYLATKYIEAEGDPVKLKTFVNLELAESWKGAESITAGTLITRLLKRREAYSVEVPEGVVLLTAGIDTQEDWLEIVIVGWGAGEESWAIGHYVLYGDVSGFQVWDNLDRLLEGAREGIGGTKHYLQAMALDTGGHNTLSVYSYCLARLARRVWAIKGGDDDAAPPWPTRASRNNKAKIPLYTVNTRGIKETLHARVQLTPPGPGSMHFPTDVDQAYFEQLLGQRLVRGRRKGSGRMVRQWIDKPNTRHEVLDCWAYAYAALHGMYSLGFKLPRAGIEREGFEFLTSPLRRNAEGKDESVAPVNAASTAATAALSRQPARKTVSRFLSR